MPLLPLTTPRPPVDPKAPKAPADPALDKFPYVDEPTIGCEWPGEFTKLADVGLTLTAGWGGAVLRLVHAQVYKDGSRTPAEFVDLLVDGEGEDEAPYAMTPLERRHFGPLPVGTGAVTVQYECTDGSLHALFEYKPK